MISLENRLPLGFLSLLRILFFTTINNEGEIYFSTNWSTFSMVSEFCKHAARRFTSFSSPLIVVWASASFFRRVTFLGVLSDKYPGVWEPVVASEATVEDSPKRVREEDESKLRVTQIVINYWISTYRRYLICKKRRQ